MRFKSCLQVSQIDGTAITVFEKHLQEHIPGHNLDELKRVADRAEVCLQFAWLAYFVGPALRIPVPIRLFILFFNSSPTYLLL